MVRVDEDYRACRAPAGAAGAVYARPDRAPQEPEGTGARYRARGPRRAEWCEGDIV